MKKKITDMMEIMQGDITKLDVDAIVNAANRSLLGGGGVDGAIHRAAGPKLLEECRNLGGCDTGDAKITKGYNLKARHVIHTVGPVYSGKAQDGRLLSQCYFNSMRLASDNKLKSIAFPAISCGVYGYPVEEACKIAVDTVRKYLEDGKSSVKRVLFVLFSTKDYDIYKKYFDEISET
jgi:O-acetyl-ADP-ribose deacetylase (regulator of RNase III)